MDLADSMKELRRQNEELVRVVQELVRQVAEMRRDVDGVRAEYYKHSHDTTKSSGNVTSVGLPL